MIRLVTRCLAALAILLCFGQCGGETLPTTQKNLLIVTFDTLRADYCDWHGERSGLTPVLNELAEEGIVFEQAYSISATTAPSHVTLFTGRYPGEHGVVMNGLELPSSEVTIAEVLQDAGYRSAAFVSSFTMRERFDYHQGFEFFDDDFGRNKTGREARGWVHADEKLKGYLDRNAEDTIEQATAWLRKQSNTRPWILWVHLFDPHAPYAPPEPFATQFAPASDADENTSNRALYSGDVAYTDSSFEALLATVREVEGPAGTLIALTSDHGELLGEHDWTGHGIYLYEDAMHVPWVYFGPGLSAARHEDPIGHVDFAPTTLGLLGFEVPEVMRGRDLSQALLAGESPEKTPVLMRRRDYDSKEVSGISVEHSQWAYRKGDWKLIYTPDAPAAELYNLSQDPEELRDLSVEQEVDALALMAEVDAILAAMDPSQEIGERSEEVIRALEQLGYVR